MASRALAEELVTAMGLTATSVTTIALPSRFCFRNLASSLSSESGLHGIGRFLTFGAMLRVASRRRLCARTHSFKHSPAASPPLCQEPASDPCKCGALTLAGMSMNVFSLIL